MAATTLAVVLRVPSLVSLLVAVMLRVPSLVALLVAAAAATLMVIIIFLAVASHLSPVWFGPLRWLYQSRHFHTDRGATKIQSLLKSRGIPYTTEAISEFLRRHGASYVELECILERHPGRSLDQALQLSHKLDGITIEKAKNWKPMTPVLEIPPSGTGAET